MFQTESSSDQSRKLEKTEIPQERSSSTEGRSDRGDITRGTGSGTDEFDHRVSRRGRIRFFTNTDRDSQSVRDTTGRYLQPRGDFNDRFIHYNEFFQSKERYAVILSYSPYPNIRALTIKEDSRGSKKWKNAYSDHISELYRILKGGNIRMRKGIDYQEFIEFVRRSSSGFIY
jgi:hypothetical protein